MIQNNVHHRPGDTDCRERRERYQNVWIVLFKFIYIVSSLVPAQMMTLIRKLIMGKPCKAKLRSVAVTRRLYKKKIADKRKILVAKNFGLRTLMVITCQI